MAKLTLVQVVAIVAAARVGCDSPTTVVIQDTRTEISVEEINGLTRPIEYEEYGDRENEADFGFDYEEEASAASAGYLPKEHLMKEAMLKAMRRPAIREQIGEVIPILRAMSPAQRLTLAALVSSQIMSQGRLDEASLTEMAASFAGNNVDNLDDRQNITEHLLLPISVDVARIFRGLGKDAGRSLRPEMPPRTRPRRPYLKPPPRRPRPSANRRMDVFLDEELDRKQRRNTTKELQNLISEGVLQPSVNDCEYFSSSFCLEVTDYPLDAIIKSVEKHQGIMDTLLEDFRIQSPDANGEDFAAEKSRMRRRQDTGANEVRDGAKAKESVVMCPSSVKYARPKRARTTAGQWKYVVNAGDYTQTLRLEICLKPTAPCSYLTNNFNSHCTQVYNYHRLLTWEENKGLHMDIFKVPSCCSCHIQGYNAFYPPAKDFSFAEKRREPISLRPSYGPEPEIQLFANPSTKREVVRPPPAHTASPPTYLREPELTPLHHLIPPGPPLPLEGEGIKFRNEHKKRGSEHRRIAEVAPHRLEIGEAKQQQTAGSAKYANVVLAARLPPERSRTQAKFFAKQPTTIGTSSTTTATSTATTTTTTTSTTRAPPHQTASGRRKVNYNYHPIIEFFIPDYVNATGQQYSQPLTSPLTSQEWRPVVGRGRSRRSGATPPE